MKHEAELCRLRLHKTDTQLKCNQREQLDISQGAIHRKFGGDLQNEMLNFPPIHSTDNALHPQLGIPQARCQSIYMVKRIMSFVLLFHCIEKSQLISIYII